MTVFAGVTMRRLLSEYDMWTGTKLRKVQQEQ